MSDPVVGTVDIPARLERERYFRALHYLELSALFAGPLKPSSLAKWAEVAPAGSIGLAAPAPLTHRKAPSSTSPWPADAAAGDFRDSPTGRVALAALRTAIDKVSARCAVFRSPPLFAPSAANRDQLRAFFGELATDDALGCERVWVPDGLWEPRTAIKFATELGITCALDPLVREPGMPPEIYYDLDVESLYLRVEGLGHTGKLKPERLEDIAMLVEHYAGAGAKLTVAFASAERWNDAKNFAKLVGELDLEPSDDDSDVFESDEDESDEDESDEDETDA